MNVFYPKLLEIYFKVRSRFFNDWNLILCCYRKIVFNQFEDYKIFSWLLKFINLIIFKFKKKDDFLKFDTFKMKSD